ncbi:hydantoinase/oxoprolinase family protein [Dactylosporangium sp. CA-092794]|uniref:hydantoinase/oxoprolinase family protein n=1 Tax=Dactylosporangium sp. CA-092794 TaxID=3239929 RepID=UPI003D910037
MKANPDSTESPGPAWRLGVDIGGTFTDVILLGPNAETHTAKVLSTPPNFAQGVVTALDALCADVGADPAHLIAVLHGTTVATNAILEGAGARTGLITTRGFRDVLELGRLRRPSLYDLQWVKPEPLAARHLRVELPLRIAADGSVLADATDDDVLRLVDYLLAQNVQAVAVCLLNSYARPDAERRVAELVRAHAPSLFVTASVDVSPEMHEFERTSTAVVNSYVGPVVHEYVAELVTRFRARGVRAPLLVMQSAGGLLDADAVVRQPVQIIESGPAAGVIAVQHLARSLGLSNVVAFDMGGTTAKASLLENGTPFISADYEVGGGMNIARGLSKGGGYVIRFPSIDIAEVGAGGGSIIHADTAGALHAGPHSASAFPGPACYGRGGDRPTLTDANVVLGYLSPSGLAGGRVEISAELARKVLADVGGELGIDAVAAARGAYEVAVSNMTRAVKAVTSERGRDPRDSVLVAFGGAGPLYGAYLAKALGIGRVLVPRYPGLFSAVGLLTADTERHLVRPFTDQHQDVAALAREVADMEAALRADLGEYHASLEGLTTERVLDMRYRGQRFELRIPMPPGQVDERAMARCRQAFHAEHRRTYGRSGSDALVQIVNVRVIAKLTSDLAIRSILTPDTEPVRREDTTRTCRFDEERTTLVTTRDRVAGTPTPGPAIIEDMDSTVLVPPGASYHRDPLSNIVIDWPADGKDEAA